MRLSTPAFPSTRHPSVLLVLLALVGLGAAGCGGSMAESKAAAGADTAVPLTDASSALAELSRAEGELAALLGPAAPAQPSATATAEAVASSPPAEAPISSSGARVEALSDRPAGDPCSVACRALASMERAASHLCGLSGEADPSCTSARERVKSATDRVSARCPCGR